jgi:methylmalonyl-CoA mutase, N-terminal domain
VTTARDRWQAAFDHAERRDADFDTMSGLPVAPVYGPDDGEFPGEWPYTRGPYASMYRSKLWTMRMFAGFGTAPDTNRRFRELLAAGGDGLSTAFDLPTLMGRDSDDPLSLGEVGKCGVAIDTLADMEDLYREIDLAKVTTSMTINSPAAILLAMYIAVAERGGASRRELGGTLQNDILKEYQAQKEFIFPPRPSMRIVADTMRFCTAEMPRWHPISVSGYHIREAGSTAAQELAFTLANGFAYVEAGTAAGLAVDDFAPRLSFFFDIHNDFFEEIAKLRAARRIWATVMRNRFGATKAESMRLRTHTQTAGVSATAQQPLNNVARVALQALAAVLGGAQSLHTNSFDEVLALPTEDAVTVALRTQQIIAEESGVPLTVDPLGGSYFLEKLTDEMETRAMKYIRQIDELGGMVAAIDHGYPQREIADAAYRYQLMDDRGEKTVVGVNKYVMAEERPLPILKIDDAIEREQVERVGRVKAARDAAKVERRLKQLAEACRNGGNVMPVLVDAVKDYVSLGEISDVYRQVFGLYREPIIF